MRRGLSLSLLVAPALAGLSTVAMVLLLLGQYRPVLVVPLIDQPFRFAWFDVVQVQVVAVAGLAVLGVVVEQQFDDVAPGLPDLRRVGPDLHPLPDFLAAGGEEVVEALHLHHADAAGALQAEVVGDQ